MEGEELYVAGMRTLLCGRVVEAVWLDSDGLLLMMTGGATLRAEQFSVAAEGSLPEGWQDDPSFVRPRPSLGPS